MDPRYGQQAQLLPRAQAAQDLFPRQPLDQARRSSTQGGVHAVPAQHRDLGVNHARRCPTRMLPPTSAWGLGRIVQAKAYPIQPKAFDLIGPQIAPPARGLAGGRRQPIQKHLRLCRLCHRTHPFVLSVQDRHPTRGQGAWQLALGLRNPLEAPHALQVHRTYVRHNPNAGTRDLAQQRDLARSIGAHFQNHSLVPFVEIEQGQRQADLVVIVALALEHPVALGQHRGDQFLGRRLAHAPRDPNHPRREPGPPPGRQAL